MTDRDTFAAAALTGLLHGIPDGTDMNAGAAAAYSIAEAMLRERERRFDAQPRTLSDDQKTLRNAADILGPGGFRELAKQLLSLGRRIANHDAAPAAKARTDDGSVGTDKAEPLNRQGTGKLSKNEIDALQHVVEDGRFVDLSDYGYLRSLLVRLRPEWEEESDRSEPIKDERLAALEQLSALDQELELQYGLTGNPMIKAQDRTPQRQPTQGEGPSQGECRFRDSRNAKEPVAWWIKCNEYESVTLLREHADAMAEPYGTTPIPLYRSPTLTDAEREAIGVAMHRCDGPEYKTLRGLLERTK